jgi:BirA family biotin operon repressor/biotin-[acetyl-CoA-carboxylase] ligase
LAVAGAPQGTLVTAAWQSAGRGRQGRSWFAPAGATLLCSLVVRGPPRLLSLAAGVAVADLVSELAEDGGAVQIKWPNDILLHGGKVAGLLVEGRPQEEWAILGIGLNVALDLADLPPALRDGAATLGLGRDAIEPTLTRLLELLGHWLVASSEDVVGAVRTRDALIGQLVTWAGGSGTAAGIDEDGRLVVNAPEGRLALDAGDVHLLNGPAGPSHRNRRGAGLPQG